MTKPDLKHYIAGISDPKRISWVGQIWWSFNTINTTLIVGVGGWGNTVPCNTWLILWVYKFFNHRMSTFSWKIVLAKIFCHWLSENDENNDSSLNDFLSQSWSGDYQKVSCNIRELLTFAKNHHHWGYIGNVIYNCRTFDRLISWE